MNKACSRAVSRFGRVLIRAREEDCHDTGDPGEDDKDAERRGDNGDLEA